MSSRMRVSDMLRVVLGIDNVPAGFSDWYCGICNHSVTKKGDLVRHWRCPIPCQADGCKKSYRDDKFKDYCSHHRHHHMQSGRPLFTVADLKRHFDDKTLELKHVIDPMYCPKSLVHDQLPVNMSIPNCGLDEVRFEPPTPPSGIIREEGHGVGVEKYTPAFDESFPAGDVLPPVAPSTVNGTWNMSQPIEYGAGFGSVPQQIGADIGFGHGPEWLSPLFSERKTQLLVQINAGKAEIYDLDQVINAHFADLLRGQNEAYHQACILGITERKQDLERTILALQAERDSLA